MTRIIVLLASDLVEVGLREMTEHVSDGGSGYISVEKGIPKDAKLIGSRMRYDTYLELMFETNSKEYKEYEVIRIELQKKGSGLLDKGSG